MPSDSNPRQDFRLLVRRRNAYDDGTMTDVQLQVARTGALVWSQSFSDEAQAEAFQAEVEADLDQLDDAAFRAKHSVPSDA